MFCHYTGNNTKNSVLMWKYKVKNIEKYRNSQRNCSTNQDMLCAGTNVEKKSEVI